jgi:hypothetical protein
MTHFRAATILLSTVLACASASAATLNFESLSSGNTGSPSASLPEALISGTGTVLYTNEYFAGQGGSVCSAFTTSSSTSCTGDLQISFTTAVNQLSLRAIGLDDGDSVTISAYAGNSLLGSRLVAAPQDVIVDPQEEVVVDFSAFSGVTKLVFDDQSTGSGLAYGKFSFTSVTAPVPEPATGVLMLLGAAALGSFVRRQQAA